MSVTRVLLDILVVLLAAKLGAEGSERIGIPAVVGEIVAGIVIGPSAMHLVGGGDDVLRVLGELGVILLLLDVGLEMDLGELAAVGRAALSVATVGVIVPFVAGAAAASAMGMAGKEAIFVGAALTATSVGITARVFGDLHALATVEARTVLGAAVADDVMGLVILTVVTRLVSQGSVSVNSVTWIVLVAVGFLTIATFVGIRFAPWTFHHVNRLSRSGGTLVALSLVFTLAIAELADQARLAPIVGAFVAGLALSRSPLSPRIRRELLPVGHLLIPIFFVQIGIDAQINQFARLSVLRVAGVLLLIAVVGKIAAAAGMWRSPGDRVLVGLGMIPRGEVGLIFATIGLSTGIIGRDVYASLLLVVLATTLMTPSLLKWRVRQQGRERSRLHPAADDMPVGGWLRVHGGPDDVTIVDLAAEPPTSAAISVGLAAATAIATGARPSERVIGWLATLPDTPIAWDAETVAALDALLEANEPHAWRFLFVTGLLDRSLPELADALRHRRDNPFETDPTRALSWPRLDQLAQHADTRRAGSRLRLAALALDAADLTPAIEDAPELARRITVRLGLGTEAQAAVPALVRAATLLPAAAHRFDGLDEEPVLHLASYLGSLSTATDAFALAALTPLEGADHVRFLELRDRVLTALRNPGLTGVGDNNIVEQRVAAAIELIPSAAPRLLATPRPFVLSQTPLDLARQAALADPPLARRCVRTAVTPIGPGTWRLDVAVRDDVGLLAHQLTVLHEHALEVLDVATVLWPDKQSLSTFRIRGTTRPAGDVLGDEIAASIPTPLRPLALPDAAITFDNASSPWHTICTVRTDGRGQALLAAAKAFALAEVNVVAARSTIVAGSAIEVLELVDRRGSPIGDASQQRIIGVLATGEAPSLRRRAAKRRHARSPAPLV
jgi:Kef-type K+ transport system membrane component KefB